VEDTAIIRRNLRLYASVRYAHEIDPADLLTGASRFRKYGGSRYEN
jgi:hypothetical protein